MDGLKAGSFTSRAHKAINTYPGSFKIDFYGILMFFFQFFPFRNCAIWNRNGEWKNEISRGILRNARLEVGPRQECDRSQWGNRLHEIVRSAAVGGRMAAKKQAEEAERLATMDQDLVCQSYSSSEQGTHRIQPKRQDPRWSDPVRTSDATLYDSSRRDPPNRETSFLYRSTFTDALMTPCQPLAVPDVHKLRYMNNNYMTADDWY